MERRRREDYEQSNVVIESQVCVYALMCGRNADLVFLL